MRGITVLLIALMLSLSASATDFYVAPDGADDNAGTEAAPFATLSRARDAIRALKAGAELKGPVTVHVRAGAYELEETFALGPEDAGTEAAPIVYRGYKDERPVLLGGKQIAGFTAHEGEILKADVGAQGFEGVQFKTLVFDGERQQLARYPNHNPEAIGAGDWAHVDGERFSMYEDSPDEDDYHKKNEHLDFWQRNIPRLTQTLTMKPEDVHDWAHPEHGELSIFPRFNWWNYMVPIESFEPETRQLKLGPGSFYEIRPGDRYFIRNVFEELDSPGEWYLDTENWTLYFWPPEPLEEKAVYAPVTQTVLALDNCSNVTFQGFIIECSDGTAVTMNDCTGCVVAGSIIRNAGDTEGSGVSVEGGTKNGVVGNDIYDVGAYGIFLSGGDAISLSLAENYADNNYIHHVGRVGRHAKGIELTGAGNRVSHNLIHDVPQSGVYIWGPKHTLEYNEIRHTALEGEDTGAVGGGAIEWLDWLGSKIHYNYIHDAVGYGYDHNAEQWKSPYFTSVLYPDWAASGVSIVGNVLVRGGLTCLMLHSGHDNTLENNILVGGGRTQMYWRGWPTSEGFWATKVDGWIENYEKAAAHEAWHDVPGFRDPREMPLPNQLVMTGNVFQRNIIYYEDPEASLYWMQNVPLEHNTLDYNLIYHFGHPLKTGVTVAKVETGPNLLPNAGLEDGAAGGMPAGWNVSPEDETKIQVVNEEAHEGKQSLLIEPAKRPDTDTPAKTIYLTLGALPFEPGKTYRLSAWMKGISDDVTSVQLSAYTWKSGEHSWSEEAVAAVTTEWQQFELLFQLPKEGDEAYKATMDTLWWRINFPTGTGKFWVDDVSLREAELANEWESWQAKGMDIHSVVADPLFVDAAQDDYRLQPDSPALELGIKQIPFEKIGPYEDELRASWPIVEAPGAREAGIGG